MRLSGLKSMLPSSDAALAGVALIIMGVLSFALIFHEVPQNNQQLVTFALGAISGALTVGGSRKIADKLTQSNGPDATVTTADADAK